MLLRDSYKERTQQLEDISPKSLAKEFATELEWFNKEIKDAVELVKDKGLKTVVRRVTKELINIVSFTLISSESNLPTV